MATYAIGDVQGCFEPLMRLLDAIRYEDQDQLWFCGDLINRGPDSLATMRSIKQLKTPAIITLGNHDLHFLAIVSGAQQVKKKDTLQALLAAPDCEELAQWLRIQKLIHIDDQRGCVLVHAGIPPMWSITRAQQLANEIENILRSSGHTEFFKHMYGNSPALWDDALTGWDRARAITNYLTRMRYCDQQGALELTCKAPPGEQDGRYVPWFELPNQAMANHKILFGHWASLVEVELPNKNLVALDSGCVWGGALTAYCLETQTYTHVSANPH